MRVIQIINKETGRIIPEGYFSEETVNQCKRDTNTFEIVYDKSEPEEEKNATFHKEQLAGMSMKALREVYDLLAEGKEDAPAPTTSKDGIIKAVLEMQGR